MWKGGRGEDEGVCVKKGRGADQPLQVVTTVASSARKGVGLVKVGVHGGGGGASS